ncbi:MAG: hypothetical protein ABIF10_03855 [Candidatus Woesearchaeota archaeon]
MVKDSSLTVVLIVCVVLIAVLLIVKPGTLVGQASKAAKVPPSAKPECSDGKDNDFDGLVDAKDPGCTSRKDTSELNPNIECDDGLDNDGDLFVDRQDDGCLSSTDNDETNCGDNVCEPGEICTLDCRTNSCTDSDGGRITAVAGTVTGALQGTPYSYSDSCADTYTLREFFCESDYQRMDYLMCPSGTSYGTPYCINSSVYRDVTTGSCSGGACIIETSATLYQDCGPDYYGSSYCIGSDVYHNLYDYSCNNGQCSFAVLPQLVEICLEPCSNGVCPEQISNSCSDSDRGISLYVQGTVSGLSDGYPYSYSDYCPDSGRVWEYYCNVDRYSGYAYFCQNSTICSSGFCH